MTGIPLRGPPTPIEQRLYVAGAQSQHCAPAYFTRFRVIRDFMRLRAPEWQPLAR